MGWIILMAAVWFFVLRPRRRAWLERGTHGWQRHPWLDGREQRSPRTLSQPRVQAPPPPARESRYEALKRSFVAGDISVETYERELDALLRDPAGKHEV